MFSDGLPDARRGTEFFGEDRVHALLDTLRDVGPREIVERLMDEVGAFSASQHTDDIAIVAVTLR